MNQILGTPLYKVLGCPCKNDQIQATQENCERGSSRTSESVTTNVKTRIEKIGTFFIPDSSGSIFDLLLFERDQNYTGISSLRSPLMSYLDITDKCNLSCRLCYNDEKEVKNHISFEHLKKIIDNLSDGGVLSVQLLGGEPTLHPDFIEICKYTKSKGMRVEVVSNGQCIDEEFASKLVGLTDFFAISIDGTEENHDHLRNRKGSYEKARKAYHFLDKYHVLSEAIMTVNKKNYNDIEGVLSEVCSGNPRKLFIKFTTSNGSSEIKNEYELSSMEIDTVVERVTKLGVNVQTTRYHFDHSVQGAFFGCLIGVLSSVIDTKGNVFRCLYNRNENTKLGNIYEQGIQQIWKTYTNKNLKLQEKSGKCTDCEHRSVCGGFCNLKKERDRY